MERSLGSIERLTAPGTFDETAAGLEQSVASASASMDELVDHVFRRGVQLIAILLVGWVVAAVLIRLLTGRRKPRGPAIEKSRSG